MCGLLGAGQRPGPWHTHCSLERGQLVLSSNPFPGASERLPIQRPLFCPFAALDQQPEVSKTEPLTNRGVDLGVAVILQSSDQTVLLTRRTCTLRISPNLWVPPGGHMEPDEEILECGFRELWEECGLQLPKNQFSCVLLGLWEVRQNDPQSPLNNPCLPWALGKSVDGLESPSHSSHSCPPYLSPTTHCFGFGPAFCLPKAS